MSGPDAHVDERHYALDFVRGGALLLGVVFHAAFAFAPGPPSWMVHDTQPSDLLSGLTFAIHTFRMTLFFILAGLFGRMLFCRHGEAEFIRNRAQRVLAPFVISCFVLLPITTLIAMWGYQQSYPEILGPAPEPVVGFGPRTVRLYFLWFLNQLLLCYALALVLHEVARRIAPGRWLGAAIDVFYARALSSPLVILLVSAPAALVFTAIPGWTLWTGIPASDVGVLPQLAPTVCYGFAFAFGWFLQRQPRLLGAIEKLWVGNLVIALATTASCIAMAGFAPVGAPQPQGFAHVSQAVCYALPAGHGPWPSWDARCATCRDPAGRRAISRTHPTGSISSTCR